MMKSKNSITLFLMVLSIALLLVLQGLWLRSSYEKAFYDLRRDTNFIFRNTLFAVRDSLFAKNIKPVTDVPAADVQAVEVFKRRGADSIKFTMKSSAIQIFVNTNEKNDSIIKALQPVANHFTNAQEGRSFIVRLSPDTLSVDSLKTLFNNALKGAGFPVKAIVTHELSLPDRMMATRKLNQDEAGELPRIQRSVFRDTVFLESVRMNPVNTYNATLLNFRGFILKEIAPQILFSLIITLITIIAFVVLYRNLRAQQRLMTLKNDFISNVTHELKTPVATVSVALEALKNFNALNDPGRTQEYLDIAQKELNRLTLMTDKILKSAAFDNKGLILEKEQADVKQIVNQVLESMQLVFEKHGALVTLDTTGERFVVSGSIAHLTNVVFNLVDNALKYSVGNPALHLTLTSVENEVVFSISDNGVGIPAEYQKKIFEKFFRVPTGDVHNIKGYGLGLSYVSSVVKAHGGVIEVKSELDSGSTFVVHLPV